MFEKLLQEEIKGKCTGVQCTVYTICTVMGDGYVWLLFWQTTSFVCSIALPVDDDWLVHFVGQQQELSRAEQNTHMYNTYLLK